MKKYILIVILSIILLISIIGNFYIFFKYGKIILNKFEITEYSSDGSARLNIKSDDFDILSMKQRIHISLIASSSNFINRPEFTTEIYNGTNPITSSNIEINWTDNSVIIIIKGVDNYNETYEIPITEDLIWKL